MSGTGSTFKIPVNKNLKIIFYNRVKASQS